jgi:hypothetical protein
MATTRKPPQIVIALLALFCLAMVATTATAKDIEWKNKKLEFVDYNGKKCLRAEGYYFNSSGGRVITGINTISFTWQESRNGETRDGSVSFEDPPFHDQLAPGERSRPSSFRICRFGSSNGAKIKVTKFKSARISYKYRSY